MRASPHQDALLAIGTERAQEALGRCWGILQSQGLLPRFCGLGSICVWKIGSAIF